jgi:hypothetical protein
MADAAVLEAPDIAAMDAMFAAAPEATPEPSATPAPATTETNATPETPAPAVEPATPTKPVPETTQPPAATGEAEASKESAGRPASWQLSDDERHAAQALGLDEEDVRGFRSRTEFLRFATRQFARRQTEQKQPAASPQAPAQPTLPPEIQTFLDDPLQDEGSKAAVRALAQRDLERQQLLSQMQGQTQAEQQQRAAAQRQQFYNDCERCMDELDSDLLGKGANLTQAQREARQKVGNSLMLLGQVGEVKEVSRGSLERAFQFAHPDQFREHLRRSLISSAEKAQANNLGGTSPAPTRGAPAPVESEKWYESDPKLAEAIAGAK